MKPYYLYGLLAIILVAIFFIRCNTSKDTVKEKMTMIVLLQDNEKGAYLEKTYSDYQPANVKRANRTLNQYRVQFTCTKTETKTLMQQMENDPRVIKFSISQPSSNKQ